MSEWAKFNINSTVRVKLTEHGKAVIRAKRLTESANYPASVREHAAKLPPEDADGWSEWQLWCLMEEVGPLIRMCGPLVMETTIEMRRKDLDP